MNNAVFGKTMENVRNRIDFRLVQETENCKDKVHNLTRKPQYKRHVIFTPQLVGFEMNRKIVELNKPVFVGAAILDISKVHMYKFHYEHMKCKYMDRAKLLYTDTDSLVYHIETEDVYADMAEDKHLFDTSEYPKDHPLYDPTNGKVIGKFKDETNGRQIVEFVGLKPKMYAFTVQKNGGMKDHLKAKGVPKAVVEKTLGFDHYKSCLMDKTVVKRDMTCIRSSKHELYTMHMQKKALNAFCNKRYWLDDGISAYAYGHKNITVC
jgi:hypothetical protein